MGIESERRDGLGGVLRHLTFLIFLNSMQILVLFFFFNDTATTEIYTLSLHDALPISLPQRELVSIKSGGAAAARNGQY